MRLGSGSRAIWTRPLPARCRTAALFALFAAAAGLPGCGGPTGPHGTVHGKLTYNGGPVAPGTAITFVGDNGAGAAGAVGEDGAYYLSTPQGNAVPVGKYKVVLIPPKSGAELSPEEAMEASMKAGKDGVKEPPPPFPKKYMNPVTTPASYDVKEGDNEINVDLVDG